MKIQSVHLHFTDINTVSVTVRAAGANGTTISVDRVLSPQEQLDVLGFVTQWVEGAGLDLQAPHVA